jgi:hypothetical protein
LLEVRRGESEVRDVQNIADVLVDPERALERRNHWEKTSHSLLVGAILHAREIFMGSQSRRGERAPKKAEHRSSLFTGDAGPVNQASAILDIQTPALPRLQRCLDVAGQHQSFSPGGPIISKLRPDFVAKRKPSGNVKEVTRHKTTNHDSARNVPKGLFPEQTREAAALMHPTSVALRLQNRQPDVHHPQESGAGGHGR